MSLCKAYVYIAVAVICFVESHAKPPNIVLIVADDLGWNDVGYHGSEIHTPTLDKLAAEGVKLENYYVQPICSPTRSQLLTGRYQIHTGLQHSIIWAQQPNGIPLEIPTVADKLRAQGYSTHMVGKWHLGFSKKEYTPVFRGFDSFMGLLNAQGDYFTHIYCDNKTGVELCGLDFYDNMDPVWDKYGQYSTHVFADRARNLLADHARYNREKPMFLYLPFQSPHKPLQVPNHYTDRYRHIKDSDRRTYAGMVTYMDEAIANITQAMKDHHMWQDTLLVVTTDNGGWNPYGGNNWPLRGEKATLWEGGIRGVGFVHSPLLETTGVQNHELIHVSDWFPTLISLAGGSTAGLKLDGYNVWASVSRGQTSPRKELLHNIDPLYTPHGPERPGSPFDVRTRAALRVGNWKIITGNPEYTGTSGWIPPPHMRGTVAVPNITDDPLKNLWLFDIQADPTETADVSALYPHVVQRLLRKLAVYNATAVPCRYPPFDPRSNPALHGGVWGPWERGDEETEMMRLLRVGTTV